MINEQDDQEKALMMLKAQLERIWSKRKRLPARGYRGQDEAEDEGREKVGEGGKSSGARVKTME
jgi:hypothetical protein